MHITIKRRNFLKTASGLTAFGLGLNAIAPEPFRRLVLSQAVDPNTQARPRNVVAVFLRGGVDGISMVPPHGDNMYNTTARKTLYRDPAGDFDLGNSFAALHPALVQAPYYGVRDLWQAGQLAVIHRVGYKNQSQSHFDSQQYWENGTLNAKLEVGMFNRLVQETYAKQGNSFPAAGLSSSQLVVLRGPEPVPNFSNIQNYTLSGSPAQVNKFRGREGAAGVSARGLLGFYGGSADFPEKTYRQESYRTGLVLLKSMQEIGQLDPNYTPENGAIYQTTGLGNKFRDTARLLKLKNAASPSVDINLVCFNQGGFDTHTNQAGGLSNLLYELGRGIQALSLDLGPIWDDTLVVTMSEFGRTSVENGSLGTDHGNSTAVLAAGGKVNGGVYNADAATWADGDIFSSSSGRYLAHKYDYRALFAEIFTDYLGITQTTLNKVIPNYDGLKTADPTFYARRGFIKLI